MSAEGVFISGVWCETLDEKKFVLHERDVADHKNLRIHILKRRESGKPERLASHWDKAIHVDILSAARA